MSARILCKRYAARSQLSVSASSVEHNSKVERVVVSMTQREQNETARQSSVTASFWLPLINGVVIEVLEVAERVLRLYGKVVPQISVVL